MIFDWDPEKNEKIKRERGISFEEIALLLGAGRLWAVTKHWNPERYPRQRIFLIPIDGQIYAVPFVQDEQTFFLKTAFPSRKMTQRYREEQNDENA
ncbi:MAG: toxin [Verrucomicrobiota bacterium]